MSDRFDILEYRAARTMGEVDYFFKRQTRIVAARLDLPPAGVVERIRKVIARLFWKEGAL